MATWNQPQWGQQPAGTIAAVPSFPELYIRNFLNDEGILAFELTPVQRVVDSFTVSNGIYSFTLSKLPSQDFSPIVYRNNVPQYPNVNYTINSRTVTFPLLSNGDIIKVIYAS